MMFVIILLASIVVASSLRHREFKLDLALPRLVLIGWVCV